MDLVATQTAGWIRGALEVETVSVALQFDPADPFAVRLEIDRGDTRSAVEFSRDLLADGLRSMVPLGEGSVSVQATSVLTEITFQVEPGEAQSAVTLRLPWWNTREFVRLTQLAVARGSEQYDIDALLDDIFDPPGTLHN